MKFFHFRRRTHLHRGDAAPPPGGFTFPTFASTGGNAGTRTNDATSSFSSGQTWTDKAFTFDPIDLTGVSNITFTNCSFVGGGTGNTGSNRVFVDCDFNGSQYGSGAGWSGQFGSYTGCRFWNSSVAFWDNGNNTLEECFAGELYVAGESHAEAIMASGSNSTFYHCTFFGQYKAGGNQTTPGGGISAALAMYTHGETWGAHSNVDLTECLLSAPDANTVVYWGSATGGDDPLTNCNATGNIIRKAPGSTTGSSGNGADFTKNYFGGSGNSVTGNVYEDDGLPCGGND